MRDSIEELAYQLNLIAYFELKRGFKLMLQVGADAPDEYCWDAYHEEAEARISGRIRAWLGAPRLEVESESDEPEW